MPSTPLKMAKKKSPWYCDGLRFECTQCGACCSKEPGYVWTSEEELVAIADFLKVSIADLAKNHLRIVDGKISLKEDPKTFDCTFLKDNRCSIYSVRPKQCRTFPWWKDNLESPKTWKETARRCEGINDNAPIVPLEKIEEELAKNG